MAFETGKYYRHTTGEDMHILGDMNTTLYGRCLIAESNQGELKPVGGDESSAVNWSEISADDWMQNFST